MSRNIVKANKAIAITKVIPKIAFIFPPSFSFQQVSITELNATIVPKNSFTLKSLLSTKDAEIIRRYSFAMPLWSAAR
jgi:hypothetical protein